MYLGCLAFTTERFQREVRSGRAWSLTSPIQVHPEDVGGSLHEHHSAWIASKGEHRHMAPSGTRPSPNWSIRAAATNSSTAMPWSYFREEPIALGGVNRLSGSIRHPRVEEDRTQPADKLSG